MSRINGSALMFDEEDIKRTSEFLPRLSRIIMFAAGITNDGYTTRYHKYFKSMFPTKSRKEFTQQSAADRKSLLDREKLTFSRMRIILSAMGYDIEEAYDDNPAIIKLWQKHGIKTVYVQGFGFYYSLEDVSNEGNN